MINIIGTIDEAMANKVCSELTALDPNPGVQRVYNAAEDYMNKEPYDTKK